MAKETARQELARRVSQMSEDEARALLAEWLRFKPSSSGTE